MNGRKVVQIIPALTRGGAERMVVDLGNGLAELGDQVHMIPLWDAGEAGLQSMVSTRVKVTIIQRNKERVLARYLRSLHWLLNNWRWLRSTDIVHVHLTQPSLMGTALYFLRCASRGRYPRIVETYHAVGMPINKRLRTVHRLNMRFRDGLVLMAEDSYWSTFMSRAKDLSIEKIPNGVSDSGCPASLDSVQLFFQSLGLRQGVDKLVGIVSRVTAERSPLETADVLIRVLIRTKPETHVVWGGDGPLRAQLEKQIEASGVGHRFHLLGPVTDPNTLMTASSVYLTLSVREISGISALEAVFCKTPVVAIQMDKSYQASKEDFIWSSTSNSQVESKIIGLLSDKEARQSFSGRQQAIASTRFNKETMTRLYDEFYAKIEGAPLPTSESSRPQDV